MNTARTAARKWMEGKQMSKYIRKRYIDAETLKSYLNPIARKTDCHFLQLIDNIPIADVEEVRHGEWLYVVGTRKEEIWMCNQCERCIRSEQMEKDELIKLYPYCHCGAKMDGGIK